MRVEHHDLHHEFPEHNERIHDLKGSDAHFARLFEKYDELTHAIRRIEKADVPVADSEMEKLKFERVHLKDELYAYLKKA